MMTMKLKSKNKTGAWNSWKWLRHSDRTAYGSLSMILSPSSAWRRSGWMIIARRWPAWATGWTRSSASSTPSVPTLTLSHRCPFNPRRHPLQSRNLTSSLSCNSSGKSTLPFSPHLLMKARKVCRYYRLTSVLRRQYKCILKQYTQPFGSRTLKTASTPIFTIRHKLNSSKSLKIANATG